MTTKHTPGPWTAQPRKSNFIDVCHDQRDTKGAITLSLCKVQSRDSWIDESHANARLIAAAPELLEALQNLLKVHEGIGGTKYHAGDIARAAIAKATGEQ